ncbi:MAG: radical SAM protein [Candidatus Woesearchaeota archaeon]|nr:radical SAM protein [Candidatus Woesearchaeota archaeon]
MAKLEFENLEFEEDKQNKEYIKVNLLKSFFFFIERKKLEKIGPFKLGRNFINFDANERKASKFYALLSESIKTLKNSLNNKDAVYIHKNSGIPLIGSLSFGIVDRGTKIIEIKPITGCNLNCIFCSVDEGLSSKKTCDFVVEEEYLIDELKKLLDFKKSSNIEICINPHGEPLLYADIVKLIKDASNIKYVKEISIMTNGCLLTKDIIDKMKEAGLTKISFSVNSLDENNSKMLAGLSSYSIKKVKEMMEYAGKKGFKVVVAPVWVKGMNDKDIEEIIIYAKKNEFDIGIQKYIAHKKGRNPKGVKEQAWADFYKELRMLEKKHNIKLVMDSAPEKTKELPVPLKTGDIIKAKIVCNGRIKSQKIASAKQRAITVINCDNEPGHDVKLRIKKSKNNIFLADCLK